jgi:hypothetical protein
LNSPEPVVLDFKSYGYNDLLGIEIYRIAKNRIIEWVGL